MRPTRVEIDLSAIKHNISLIRGRTKGRIMMAIKADAYGHGAETVGRFVQDNSLVDMLGVSCIEEGLQLRKAGVRLPILIFGLISGTQDDIDAVFSQNLTPTVVDVAPVEALIQGARKWNRSIAVHVKTDTGMGRLGLHPEKTLVVIEHLASLREIKVAGLYTHFPVSDEPGNPFTEAQIRQFIELSNRLASMHIDVGLRHLANSGAVINHPESFMDLVRPGILCYGLYPAEGIPRLLDVRPAMTLKTAVMFVKRVRKGTGLSYGLTYRPERDTTIATIPIGYADGYSRSLSNTGRVLIAGRHYPVVGRICMDQTLIDLGDDTYPVGQEVVLFGPDSITAATVAAWCGTIPYEVTCDMSRRVPRMYSGNTQDAA
ncbi:MAG TPA: alanine racemase [Deltaproteobacteria bacterium]|nr:alanine racemase [Deltaproteobacteria bacterium]HPR55861.1 alanine racemase [Deltaproteobacteria bacterium]HXK48133.1 alanine racemase [Deltaproteobacteria bacterium]